MLFRSQAMTDIVERLRWSGQDAMTKHLSMGMWKLHEEAAAEIERWRSDHEHMLGDNAKLRAVIERLRAALGTSFDAMTIASELSGVAEYNFDRAIAVARAALKDTKP